MPAPHCSTCRCENYKDFPVHWAPDNQVAACGKRVHHYGMYGMEPHWVNGNIYLVTCGRCLDVIIRKKGER